MHSSSLRPQTRCIDDVNVVVTFGKVDFVSDFPIAEGGSRLNGDALLSLQLHRIHLSTDSISAANFMDGLDAASVEQNALCQSCLARTRSEVATNERRREISFVSCLFWLRRRARSRI